MQCSATVIRTNLRRNTANFRLKTAEFSDPILGVNFIRPRLESLSYLLVKTLWS